VDALRRLPLCLLVQVLLRAAEDEDAANLIEDVFLSYTGGTTGLPKGVRYTIGRGVTNSLKGPLPPVTNVD
jgi:acyl-CoA synthetase (AMP-forming)/AMP-acid ligase II